jgi:uncharacterized protein YdeI (YjbR/CyaY-like superfamily)
LSEENPRYFKTIEEWRSWLRENHDKENILWIIIQKKASKKQGIRYEEAVLEAVAYGWIDGRMKRLNDDEFKQRFTPRRSGSNWSKSNRERAEALIKEERMMPAGLKTVEEAKSNGRWEKALTNRIGTAEVPQDLLDALKKNKTAFENFESFPPYARFMYIHWVNEAKRENTRERRIYTVVDRSEKDLKPGIDLRISKKPSS